MAQSGLSSLNQSLSDIGDAECGFVRRGNVVVDDRSQIESNIVFGHAHLSWYFDNLNLNVNLNKSFRQRIDVDKTRIDSSCEFPELRDQTNVTLADRLVWIGTDNAAGNGSCETNARSKSVDCDLLATNIRDIDLATHSSTHTSHGLRFHQFEVSAHMMVGDLLFWEARP